MSEARIFKMIDNDINTFFVNFPEYALQCRMYALLRRHSVSEEFRTFQKFCLTSSPSEFEYFAVFFAEKLQIETIKLDEVVERLTSGIPCYFPDLLFAIKYISFTINPVTYGEIPF